MSRLGRALRLFRRLPAPLLVPLLASAVLAGYFAVRFARFEYHYRAADRAHEREEFAEAGEHLAACLRLDPDSARAHFRAARVARRSAQYDLAEESLIACEDLGWDRAAVSRERALLAFQKGDSDPESERILHESVTEDNPDRFLVLESMALGYMRSYQLTKALRCLDLWVEGRPDSHGARARRGWVHERLDRLPDAEQDYRAALRLRPDDRESKARLAAVLVSQKKIREAADVYEELWAGAGESDPGVGLGLAQCWVALGQNDQARPLLERLSRDRPGDHRPHLEGGKLALTEGRLAEARASLKKAADNAPHSYEAHYQLFLCLKRLGEESEAERVGAKVKSIEADLKKMGQLTEALQRRPHDPDLRFQIATIFLRSGEEAEAALWLRGVVRLAPSHRKARELLAEVCERTGRTHEARQHRQALPAE